MVRYQKDLVYTRLGSHEVHIWRVAPGDLEWPAVLSEDEKQRAARRFFCPEECSQLVTVAAGEKPAAFFRCWTRKEAYLKATGDGLSAPLDQFRVTFDAEQEAQFVHINHSREEAAQWTLQNLLLDSPYVGALAYLGPPKQLQYFTA